MMTLVYMRDLSGNMCWYIHCSGNIYFTMYESLHAVIRVSAPDAVIVAQIQPPQSQYIPTPSADSPFHEDASSGRRLGTGPRGLSRSCDFPFRTLQVSLTDILRASNVTYAFLVVLEYGVESLTYCIHEIGLVLFGSSVCRPLRWFGGYPRHCGLGPIGREGGRERRPAVGSGAGLLGRVN